MGVAVRATLNNW